MYLIILFVLAIVITIVDFMLLTNFKASSLIVASTILAIFLNYKMTIIAIEETAFKYRAGIFSNWKWYRDEFSIAYKSFVCAFACVVVIILFWYFPNDYSINFIGLSYVLLFVPIASFISGILGTKRGLEKQIA